VDELESAIKDADKIRSLRDEVARIKNLIVGTKPGVNQVPLASEDLGLAKNGQPIKTRNI